MCVRTCHRRILRCHLQSDSEHRFLRLVVTGISVSFHRVFLIIFCSLIRGGCQLDALLEHSPSIKVMLVI